MDGNRAAPDLLELHTRLPIRVLRIEEKEESGGGGVSFDIKMDPS